MARKSVADRKKDAKKRIQRLENPFLPSSKPNTIAFLILEGAKLGAEILIDNDPLGIIQPTVANVPTPRSPLTPFISADQALLEYRMRQTIPAAVPVTVENLEVLFDAQPNPEQAYNDARDLAEINQDQELENALAKLSKTRPTKFKKTSFGSGRFQGQFSQGMGFNLPKPKRKRTKAMKTSDKKLSAAFKKANMMCRKKNGQFKKGKSQADVAKCAHRLRKKM